MNETKPTKYDRLMSRVMEAHAEAVAWAEKAKRSLIVAEMVADECGITEPDDGGLNLDVSANLSMRSVYLYFHASKDQSLADIKPALKIIAGTRIYEPAMFDTSGTPSWVFMPRAEYQSTHAKLTVWAFIMESNRCRYVETGEFRKIPVRKLVCDGEEVA